MISIIDKPMRKQATGKEISFAYDALDRLQEVSFSDRRITYEYNPAFLTEAKCYQSDQLKHEYRQTTDWRGRVLHSRCPNNLSLIYRRDALGRCTAIETAVYQQQALYDIVGNLKHLSVQDPIGAYDADYIYDDLDQLIAEMGPFANQYHFDSLNNRRTKNASDQTINDLNQVVDDSTNQYTYDKNGRRIGKGNERYTYDALGRLIEYTGDHAVRYRYDPFGRLMEQCSNGNKVEYLYQFDTEIASFENGQMTGFKAIHGVHAPFAIEIEGKPYAVIRNHRGDITALLDQENIVTTYRYDAFGAFVHEGKIESPWLLSGQRFDKNTGTYQFAKRAYDPRLGVWLTPDPAGFTNGPNLYAYVNNNPLIYVDPYGLWKEECQALDRNVKEFSRGAARGFVDDSSFGTADYVLGEHQHTLLSNRVGYYTGTAGSLAAGCFYGTTWIKGGLAGAKWSLTAYRTIKNAFTLSKSGEDKSKACVKLPE